jgi:glycerol-3-phosphate cytidylyltransferase
MKRAMVFGSFDIIHRGHLSFLRQARRKGRWLIASVARDSFIKSEKNREPVHSEQERITQVLETKLVREAYLADEKIGTYTTVLKAKPDVICLGHDQERLKANLEEWMQKEKIEIPIYVLKPFKPERYKSSKLIRNATDTPRKPN